MNPHDGHTIVETTTYADGPNRTFDCIDCGVAFTEEHRP